VFATGLALCFVGVLLCLAIFVLTAIGVIPESVLAASMRPWATEFAWRYLLPLLMPLFNLIVVAVAARSHRDRNARLARRAWRWALAMFVVMLLYTIAVGFYPMALGHLVCLAGAGLAARVPTPPPAPVRDRINLYR